VIETLLDLARPLFAGVAGYVTVLVLVSLDRGAFVGLVAPGDVVLAVAGVYAGRGELWLPGVMIAGAIAGWAGEGFSFFLGRRYGKQIVERLPFRRRLEAGLEKTERYFRERGRRAVLLGRYVAVVGTFLPFTAGMSGMPLRRFLLVAVPGIALWSVAVTTLGYVLRAQVETLDRILSRSGWVLLAVIAVGFLFHRLWRRHRERGDEAEESDGS